MTTPAVAETNLDWHTSAKQYLDRICYQDWKAWSEQNAKLPKSKRGMWGPCQDVRDMIECLNKNDEEGFKSIRLLREGYGIRN